MRWYLKGKIHKATVTETRIDYIGSITIDRLLMEKAGFEKGELVKVWDLTNGERLETYAIPARAGSGAICMNGAAARRIKKSHKVIITGFELANKRIKPRIVLVDEENSFVRYL